MSHDRGCFKCFRDHWQYDSCPDKNCVKKIVLQTTQNKSSENERKKIKNDMLKLDKEMKKSLTGTVTIQVAEYIHYKFCEVMSTSEKCNYCFEEENYGYYSTSDADLWTYPEHRKWLNRADKIVSILSHYDLFDSEFYLNDSDILELFGINDA